MIVAPLRKRGRGRTVLDRPTARLGKDTSFLVIDYPESQGKRILRSSGDVA